MNNFKLKNLQLEESSNTNENNVKDDNDIAIVGIALNLPTGEEISDYWEMLKNGEDFISEIPNVRKEDILHYLESFNDTSNIEFLQCGYLNSIDEFDSRFFNITPKEATLMSPTFRLHLEVMWHALENAGYKENELKSNDIGVFSGIVIDSEVYDYWEYIKAYDQTLLKEAMSANLISMLSTRLAYYMNLRGPAMVIDTACSSSTSAIIAAANSIKLQQCSVAVVSGGRIIYSPWENKSEEVGFESSDYRTRSFDQTADGLSFGEGVLAIVLKSHKKAIQDNDRIYGIIKGYAANQNGKTMGITSPSLKSQVDVISKSIKDAKISPESISYCETHGTGTPIGDFIELSAIDQALKKGTNKQEFCAVGSLKANHGHLYGASGICSVIKCLLAMKEGYIPPLVHFQYPNKKINFINSPVYINTKLKKWITHNSKRCIVNCYGINGTNCNLILEEFSQPKKNTIEKSTIRPITITAKTKNSFNKLIEKYKVFLNEKQCEINLDDLSYSTLVRRNHFEYRVIMLVTSIDELKEYIDAVINENIDKYKENIFIGIGENKSTESLKQLLNLYCNNRDCSILREISKLYVDGHEVSWERLFDNNYEYINLPQYPYDRTRYWIEAPQPVEYIKKQGLTNVINDKSQKYEILSSTKLSEDEKIIGSIWCKELGFKQLNVNDNYFKIGGDSILGIKIINRINVEYNINVNVTQLLKYDTISKLADYISNICKNEDNSIVINRTLNKDFHELSSAQMRIYLLEQFEQSTTRNNVYAAYIVKGALDIKRLEDALNEIIKRHEILRTAFVQEDSVPMQKILTEANIKIETGIVTDTIDEQIKKFVRKFDLANPPLIRAFVGKIDDDRQLFLFDMHHIVTDGTSADNLIVELETLYNGNVPEPLELQYKDFSTFNIEYQLTDKFKNQENYWVNQFANEIPMSNIPTTFERSSKPNLIGKKHYFIIDDELTCKINDFASKNKITPFMVTITALYVLLHKYSQDEDISIGTPTSGRISSNVQKLIGVFINILVLKCSIKGKMNIADVIQQVKQKSLEAFDNSDYGYELLVDKLNVDRNHRNPLFDVMFIFQNLGDKSINFDGSIFESYPIKNVVPKYDITFELCPKGKNIECNIEYATELFNENYIVDMTRHYIAILHSIIESTSESISQINMMDNNEILKIIKIGQGQKVPVNRTVIEHWYKSVDNKKLSNAGNNKEQTAIIFEDTITTYEELDIISNKIANYLLENYGNGEMIFPIIIERSVLMIGALLGVLKAGGSYIPIDPTYPSDRIDYILDDLETSVIITSSKVNYRSSDKSLIILDEIINNLSNICRVDRCRFDNKSYIIYTSGSTGKPKGVIIRQREMSNFVQAINNIVEINEKSKMLCVTTISFDIFVLECFATLCYGGQLILANEMQVQDVESMADLINNNNVNIAQFTPSRVQMMLALKKSAKSFEMLETIFVGGESFPEEILKELKKYTNARIINMYGPTETTVWSSYKDVTNDTLITIGKPIDNTDIFLLTSDNKLQILNGIGEIAIGGMGVSKGYVNKKELTESKFIHTNFTNEIIYKTGDLGKWADDGNLICLGRTDHQVKIRGYRVELGEIENVILKYPIVDKCAVIIKDIDGVKRIISFIKTSNTVDNNNLNISDLKEFIATKLPSYMIPSVIEVVDKIPMTSNGKIDRNALKTIQVKVTDNEHFSEPKNEIEKAILIIWKKILGIDSIGTNQKFFEVGGNSLLLIMLLKEIKLHFNIQLSLAELFKLQTIVNIGDYILENFNITASKPQATINYNQKMLDDKSTNVIEYLDSNSLTIQKVQEKEFYELSSSQMRIYLLEQIEQSSTKNNIMAAYIVKGYINIERLESALNKIIDRHEILRTAFIQVDAVPMQKIFPSVKVKIEKAGIIKDIQQEINNFSRKFDLTKPPLMRTLIGELDDDRKLVLFNIHHIIADGTSINIFIKEVESYYNGLIFETLKFQYKDYSAFYNLYKLTDDFKKQESYWLNKFKAGIPVLNLQSIYERNNEPKIKGKKYYFEIDKELFAKVNHFTVENDFTPFMVAISALYVLLHKYSLDEEISIGTPTSGRIAASVQNLIGVFINTIVLKCDIYKEMTVVEFIKQVKQISLEAFENSDYGYELLVDNLKISREENRNPLFDVMFIYQSLGDNVIKLDGAAFEEYPVQQVVPKYDLTFELVPRKDYIECNIEYSNELFDEEYIEKMSKHYINILQSMLESSNKQLRSIEIMDDQEKAEILYLGKGKKVTVNNTIIDIWYQSVDKNYDRNAIIFEKNCITYNELELLSNKIAGFLLKHYSSGDMIFPVIMERSTLLIATLLGILKAGGSYIPIDPTYPTDRIDYILENQTVSVILTTNKVKYRNSKVSYIFLDEVVNEIADTFRVNECKFDNISYIIYTSGSTGRPKGVMVRQREMSNFVQSIKGIVDINTNSNVLCVTTISFDIFVLECFVTLSYGGVLVLANETEVQDVEKMADLIFEHNVNIVQFTPSRAQMMLTLKKSAMAFERLKTIFIGGEAFPKEVLSEIKKNTEARIINMYGPTETTVWSTYKDVTDDFDITIGRPIDNTDIYLLNSYDELQIKNGVGEIAIGGMGVTKGYVNNDELTRSKFIKTSFAQGYIYKTGDLGKWSSDGNLICLGRTDYQVKIRGYRVELGEIEEVIIKYPNVSKCAVITKESDAAKSIFAFIEVEKSALDNNEFDLENLKKFLSEKLPTYMVPAAIQVVSSIPMTSNGKIDRNTLKYLNVDIKKDEGISLPSNNVEKNILRIWEKILSIKGIGCNQKFFNVGGNSLLLIMLLKEIKQSYDIELSVSDLFKLQTIEKISEYILANIDNKLLIEPSSCIDLVDDFDDKYRKVDSNKIIPKAKLKDYYELSSSQMRIYLLEQIEQGTTKYNINAAYIIKGNIDIGRLESALNKIIQRHEVLRTAFVQVDAIPVQKILANVTIDVETGDVEENIEQKVQKFVRKFDLSKPPLMRAYVGKIDKDRQLFLFDMHHIITDGTSFHTFIKELETFYNGENCNPLELQYKDYSDFYNSYSLTQEYKNQERYWLNQFEQGIPVLNLETTYERTQKVNEFGKKHYFIIDEFLYTKINHFAEIYNVTPFMITMSALYILLYKYSYDEEISIGTPTSGRIVAEVQELIGTFINTLVLKCNINNKMTILELIEEVKKLSLDAFDNSEYGYELLVEKLKIDRNINRNPLFDVMFVYQIFGERQINFEGSIFERFLIENVVPKYDLTFELLPKDNNIFCYIEYASQLFSSNYIEEMAKHYVTILKCIVENSNTTIDNVNMMNNKERETILKIGKGHKVEVIDTIIDRWYQCIDNKSNIDINTCSNNAIIFENTSITYEELDLLTNRIANYLVDNYESSEMIFPVIMERSILMIATLLGVLKAGGSYIPIDPTYPKDRIDYILDDLDFSVILTTTNVTYKNDKYNSVILDKQVNEFINTSRINKCEFKKSSYIIYTSGSTGKPKGVIIRQHEMSNFVQAIRGMVTINKESKVLCVTTISFDIFVLECFVTLCYGGQLILANETQVQDVEQIADLIYKHHVNIVQFTPSRVQMMLTLKKSADSFRALQTIFVGGEAFPEEVLKELKKHTDAQIINMYGPTETTVWSTYKDVTKDTKITIGRPIDNTDIYLLTSDNELQYLDGVGEIAIGGIGVSKGYVNNDELTRSKFIYTDFADGVIYKTGDLGKWSEDRNLICLGRTDHQVKIRGYRIELGEIEEVILQYPNVVKCAALTKNVEGVNSILSFVEVEENYINEFSVDELRTFLSTKLPIYMIPSVVKVIEKIPMTANGKTNRNALLNIEVQVSNKESGMEPKNEVEQEILNIWKKLLGISGIGCNQKFFDIGGNSLLLIRLLKDIKQSYDNILLSVGDLFKLQTINNIADYILNQSKVEKLYFKVIGFPDKFISSQKLGVINVEQYIIEKKYFEINKLSTYEKYDLYYDCIAIFLRMLSILLKTETFGINISKNLHQYVTGYVSFVNVQDFETIKNQIRIITNQNDVSEVEYENRVASENELRVLFTMDYKFNIDRLVKKFDIILSFTEEENSILMNVLTDNKVVNKNAIKYVTDKMITKITHK